MLKGLWIADDDEAAFGTGDRDVKAAIVVEKSDVSFGIRADGGEDDDVFFSSLKGDG